VQALRHANQENAVDSDQSSFDYTHPFGLVGALGQVCNSTTADGGKQRSGFAWTSAGFRSATCAAGFSQHGQIRRLPPRAVLTQV
jgi:hypothetical protein